MRLTHQTFLVLLLSLIAGSAIFAAAQARPLPGPDVQQIYQRLLPQIEKIPAFDHHAHPGFADDPDVDAMARHPAAIQVHQFGRGLIANALSAAADMHFGAEAEKARGHRLTKAGSTAGDQHP